MRLADQKTKCTSISSFCDKSDERFRTNLTFSNKTYSDLIILIQQVIPLHSPNDNLSSRDLVNDFETCHPRGTSKHLAYFQDSRMGCLRRIMHQDESRSLQRKRFSRHGTV